LTPERIPPILERVKRVMWIEDKSGGLAGPARIGWCEFEPKRRRVSYRGRRFNSLKGRGYKANYYDAETRARYWISGCHKDGGDALYNTTVEIDEDALEEYWVRIRGQPENVAVRSFRARGKHGS
jgi:hypothetical protein